MHKANKNINGELFLVDSTAWAAQSHIGLGGVCCEEYFILISIIQILHLDILSEAIGRGFLMVFLSATGQAAYRRERRDAHRNPGKSYIKDNSSYKGTSIIHSMLKSDTKLFKLCPFSRRILIYSFFQCPDTSCRLQSHLSSGRIPLTPPPSLPIPHRGVTSCIEGFQELEECPVSNFSHMWKAFNSSSDCPEGQTHEWTASTEGGEVSHSQKPWARWKRLKIVPQGCSFLRFPALPFLKELPSYFLFLFTTQRIFWE